MSANTIPVPNLPRELGPDDALAWKINLPAEVDQDRLVMDMTRVRFGGRTAGFSGIEFGEYPGSPFDHQAERASAYVEWPDHLAPEHQWPLARIDLHRGLLNANVRDRMQDGETLEQAWALALSGAYRYGIRQAAKSTLSHHHEGQGTERFIYNSALFNVLAFDSTLSKIIVGGMYLYGTGRSLIHNKRESGDSHFKQKRWSIFPRGCYQLDRLAVASVYSALPVVRCRR